VSHAVENGPKTKKNSSKQSAKNYYSPSLIICKCIAFFCVVLQIDVVMLLFFALYIKQ
jgi:hypothetical protein